MLVYQKIIFDRYCCVWSFCHLKTLEKRFEKFILYRYDGTQKHKAFVGFENACSRATTYVFITYQSMFISIHVTVDDVSFCDGLDCVYVQCEIRASTAPEMPA